MTRPLARVPALDGLRGLAILLVLAHSFNVIEAQGSASHLVAMGLDLGWIGVQLFFVLSGFLITGILLDHAESPTYFRTFFVRRVLRIFPLYYVVLFVAFVIVPVAIPIPDDYGKHQLWLWTYTANFAAPLGRGEPTLPHFWSLAVEEQFYLAWPLVVRMTLRRSLGRLVFTSAVISVVAIAVRLFVRLRFGPDAAYMFLPCRMDALAIGAIAAAALRDATCVSFLGALPSSALAMFGGVLLLGGSALGKLQRVGEAMQTFGYTIVALGFAVVVLACLDPWALPGRLLARASLRRIGLYSYGMYVFHAPIHNYIGLPLLRQFDQRPGVVIGLGYWAAATTVTFVLAALSFHAFEIHFLRFKDRFAPQDS